MICDWPYNSGCFQPEEYLSNYKISKLFLPYARSDHELKVQILTNNQTYTRPNYLKADYQKIKPMPYREENIYSNISIGKYSGKGLQKVFFKK